MIECSECGQPVHPHQMTCGSCGASLRKPPSSMHATPPDPADELVKPDDTEFTLDDPLELGRDERLVEPAAPSAATPTRRRRRPAPRRPGPASSPAFLSRAWALVVDLMLVGAASTTLPPIARLGIRAAEAASGSVELYDDVLTEQLTLIGQVVLVASYFVWMNAGAGQTIGKGLMGISVVRPDGRPPDALMSVTRLFGYLFSALPMGAGFLLAAFPPRRALHDYLAGTIVVRPRDMPGADSEDEPQ